MNDKQAHYITSVVKNGSILKAAKELGISQPSLSTWVSNIEKELGTPLFIRRKNGIILTPAGRLYLTGEKNIQKEYERFYQKSRKLTGQAEVIRIGGTPAGGSRNYADIFRHFKTGMPSVILEFTECYNRDMMNMIRNGEIDFGIGGSSYLSEEGIETIMTMQRENILLIPEGYPGYYDPSFTKKDSHFPVFRFQDIQGLPFIMPSEQVSYHDSLVSIFEQYHYQPETIFISSNTSALYEMIKAGNGIGVVASSFFSPSDHTAPYSFDPPFFTYGVIACKKGRILSEAEKELIRFTKDLVSRREASDGHKTA